MFIFVSMSGKHGWRRSVLKRRKGNNVLEHYGLNRTATNSVHSCRRHDHPRTSISTISSSRRSMISTVAMTSLSSSSSSHSNDSNDGTDDKRKMDEKYMRLALDEAQKAFAEGEVPIGAVMTASTDEGSNIVVVATGRNAVEREQDCTRHAEMICLQRGMQARHAWRLNNCVLYTTVEPCAMCLSAAALARVRRIVYATRDLRLGACGSWVDLTVIKHPFHAFDDITGGVLANESADLLRRFFKNRRKQPPRYPP